MYTLGMSLANDDFTVPIGDSLIIPADQNISCFEVVIVDDDIKEDTETFSITGSTGVTGSAVTGDISNVTILILDDDCKLYIRMWYIYKEQLYAKYTLSM